MTEDVLKHRNEWLVDCDLANLTECYLLHTFLYTVDICGAVRQFHEIYVVNG